MEFLKEILGADLYSQIETIINTYNGNEANKDKQIKLANLGGGEYVGKGKYDALETLSNSQKNELDKANALIKELKTGTKDNEGLQQKITDYEGQVAQLQKELSDAKIEAAMDRKLIAEGANASDLDYLKFQWRKKGKLALDEHGEIKGGDDAVAGLKTQCPAQFGNGGEGGKDGFVPVPNNGLPQHNQTPTVTKEDFNKMGYNARVELKQNDPELYNQMMKG